MVTRKILVLIIALLAVWCDAAPYAMAIEEAVPGALLTARDHLLKERQELMDDRANINSKLNTLFASRNQIDKALTGNPQNRQALQDARMRLSVQIGKLQQWLDQTERNLIDAEKDLTVVEAEIKRFACMN